MKKFFSLLVIAALGLTGCAKKEEVKKEETKTTTETKTDTKPDAPKAP